MQESTKKRIISIIALCYALFLCSFFFLGSVFSNRKYPPAYLNIIKTIRFYPFMGVFQGSKYLNGVRGLNVKVYRVEKANEELIDTLESRNFTNLFYYFKNIFRADTLKQMQRPFFHSYKHNEDLSQLMDFKKLKKNQFDLGNEEWTRMIKLFYKESNFTRMANLYCKKTNETIILKAKIKTVKYLKTTVEDKYYQGTIFIHDCN